MDQFINPNVANKFIVYGTMPYSVAELTIRLLQNLVENDKNDRISDEPL